MRWIRGGDEARSLALNRPFAQSKAMTRQALQACVASFSRQELRQFSRWFHEEVADKWGEQIEQAGLSGRLDAVHQPSEAQNEREPAIPFGEPIKEEAAAAAPRVAEETPVDEFAAASLHSNRLRELPNAIQQRARKNYQLWRWTRNIHRCISRKSGRFGQLASG
jgi:hypothetical protein